MGKMQFKLMIMLIGLFVHGVCVMGQAGFLPDTVVNCYGNDDTCTGSFTTHSDPNQILYNPCCFTISDPSDPFSISAVNPGYYTVSDGLCQSCTDSNLGVSYTMADCSNSPTCQDLTSQKNSGDFTIFGPVFGNINPCCGLFDEASYYSLDSGPCLPCTPQPEPPTVPQPEPPTNQTMTEMLPTIGADPHFVCPLKNGQLLCFSVQGEPDFIFNLFSDANVQANAKFSLPHPDESHALMNSSTFIQEIGLTFKAANDKSVTTKIKLSALDHTVIVSGNEININNKPVTISITNGSVKIEISSETSITESLEETAFVDIRSDIGFAVKIKFVKRHLDMAISDITGLSKKAHGIQGQFMGPNVMIDTRHGLIRIGNMAPFSVKKGEIWPYLHEPGECWYPINAGNQGEGILEGSYTDYIVEDLFDTHFKYNQF